MKRPLCVALTGGMGCGKSAAAAAFESFGIRTADADKLAHAALLSDEVRASVSALLGGEAYDGGAPRRDVIAKKVFADSALLEKFEQIVHPQVEKMWRELAQKEDILVVEVPLLFEKKLESAFDLCVSVLCSERLRRRRLEQRGMSAEQIAARDAFQMPPMRKAILADVVLFNETSLDFLKMQVGRVVSRLKQ